MKRRKWSKSFARSAPLSITGGPLGSVLFIFLSFLGIAFSTYAPQSVSSLRSGIVDGFAPVLHVVSKPMQDASGFVRDVTGLANLQAENDSLRQENLRLREWYQAAMTLDAENKSLRELMNVKIEPQNRYITARILTDSGFAFAKSVLVYAGQDDGVRKGQTVISDNGVIGRVVEVGDKVSRVLLLTDINSRVPILIESTRQNAILAGQNDQSPRIDHLPPDVTVEDGARVITSGQGGVYPYGLPVGLVRLDDNGQPLVDLFVDFNRMVYVRIIDRPDQPNLQRASSISP